MAIPLKVSHIWSRDGVKLDENDVTITDMIQEELDRLETQGTKDCDEPAERLRRDHGDGGRPIPNPPLYEHPSLQPRIGLNQSSSGPSTRGEKIIFQQCAFFNGQALSACRQLG